MKTKERKSMHEIIDETVEFYSNNPRSIGAGRCKYIGPNGTMCAFARLVTNPTQLEEGYCCSSKDNWKIAEIKDEYAGYSWDFYRNLQILHDDGDNWSFGKLSPEGEVFVKELKEQFNG